MFLSNLLVVQLSHSRLQTNPIQSPSQMGRKVLVFNNKSTSVSYTKEQLKKIFESHDVDRDGKLSWEELRKAFKHLGSRWGSYRTEKVLRLVDSNDDGYIDINIEEKLNKLVDYALERGYTFE